jgi:hypothetical protein
MCVYVIGKSSKELKSNEERNGEKALVQTVWAHQTINRKGAVAHRTN